MTFQWWWVIVYIGVGFLFARSINIRANRKALPIYASRAKHFKQNGFEGDGNYEYTLRERHVQQCRQCRGVGWAMAGPFWAFLSIFMWPIALPYAALAVIAAVLAAIFTGIGMALKIAWSSPPIRFLIRLNRYYWQDPQERKKEIKNVA